MSSMFETINIGHLIFFSVELYILPSLINYGLTSEFLTTHYAFLSVYFICISHGILHITFYWIDSSSQLREKLKIKHVPVMSSKRVNSEIICQKDEKAGSRPLSKSQQNGYYSIWMKLNMVLDLVLHFIVYSFLINKYDLLNPVASINKENGISQKVESHLFTSYLFDFFITHNLLELFFDLFYYILHYFGHNNYYFWKYVHYIHHEIHFPSHLDVYHMSIVETAVIRGVNIAIHGIFAVIIPMVFVDHEYKISSRVMSQFFVVFAEFAGHSGYNIFAKDVSFSRWILSQFGLCLNARDHDLHHQKCKWNYSKRLSIWDKLFGTYMPSYD